MSDQKRSRDEALRLAEAVDWRAQFPEVNAEDSPEFAVWIAKPGNTAAWDEINRAWGFLGDQASEPEMLTVRRAALADAQRSLEERRRPRTLRYAFGGAAAAVVMGLVVWGAFIWNNLPRHFVTGIGERRIVNLADGSKVSLDSSSEVTVHYGAHARELRLLHGQARFDVAHDVERPFSVIAADRKVVATGTAFNVDLAGAALLVTLIEGRVVVLNESFSAGTPPDPETRHAKSESIELKAGQQLTARPTKPPEIATANLQRVSAWTNGQLVFDNEPLSDVVERVNRYADISVEIDDPKIAAIKISGVFNTGDVGGFVMIITSYLPVQAVTRSDGGTVLTERN